MIEYDYHVEARVYTGVSAVEICRAMEKTLAYFTHGKDHWELVSMLQIGEHTFFTFRKPVVST